MRTTIDIKGFEKYLREEELADNTIEVYMRGVMQYAEFYKDITKENLIEFKQRMIEKYSPKTVNLRITAVLRYCDYKEIHMKLKAVKEPKQMFIENVITVQQYNKLMTNLKNDNIRWYYNILLIAKTGMRISEAMKIRKKEVIAQDLDWKGVYMTYTQLSLIGVDAIVVQGDTLLEPYTDNYPRSRVFRTLRNMGGLI